MCSGHCAGNKTKEQACSRYERPTSLQTLIFSMRGRDSKRDGERERERDRSKETKREGERERESAREKAMFRRADDAHNEFALRTVRALSETCVACLGLGRVLALLLCGVKANPGLFL